MKNFDKMMQVFDQRIEKKFAPIFIFIQKHFVVFSTSLLTVLVLFAVVRVFYQRTDVLASAINDDIVLIEKILNDIDRDCNILSVRLPNAMLDFFTVESFTGSMIGCLNLAHSDRWKGPYLKQNPVIQNKVYEIVSVEEGYFVIPGFGVRLPNGIVMGKDIIITKKTLMNEFLKSGGCLYFDGKPLGVRLKFKIGDWDAPHPRPETVEHINELWSEFNTALSFAQHNQSNKNMKKC